MSQIITPGLGGSSDVEVVDFTSSRDQLSSDISKIIELNSASDLEFTVRLNADVPVAVGKLIGYRRKTQGGATGELSIVKDNAAIVFRANASIGDNDFKVDGLDGFSVIMEKTALPDAWLITGNTKVF